MVHTLGHPVVKLEQIRAASFHSNTVVQGEFQGPSHILLPPNHLR